MELKISIEKKHFWILFSSIIIISLVFLVYATNGGGDDSNSFGHNADEIDNIPKQFELTAEAILDKIKLTCSPKCGNGCESGQVKVSGGNSQVCGTDMYGEPFSLCCGLTSK